MVFIYNLLLLAALGLLFPIWIPLVGLREKRRRTFFRRLLMEPISREGDGSPLKVKPRRIWIHALSVGEVLSAEPLVKALALKHGPENLIFTASTHTGFEMARQLIAPHVHALRHFPYDTLFSVKRALNVIRPRQVVIVETDIWPNFLHLLNQCRIPVYLVNARLSDRSFRGYRRVDFLMATLLSVFSRICVQTELDRQRFRTLGVPDVKLVIVGNIKFDQAPVSISTDELKQLREKFHLSQALPVWIAGSTHPGEEEVLSDAYQRMGASGIDTVLIVAPRDPGRAMRVCMTFKQAGINAVTLDQIKGRPRPPRVVVIDRIGLLRRAYALADVAFVGGSLVRAGGHNPLEPASVAIPVLFGPHTDDFGWICKTLVNAGGAMRVENAEQIAEKVFQMIVNKNQNHRVGRCAYGVFANHRGAVARTIAVIENLST